MENKALVGRTLELPFKLETLSGQRIQRTLIDLAKIGGTRIEGAKNLPERYAVNRVALSDADFTARNFLSQEMTGVGITNIVQHPLGLIGYYPGEDQSLPPVIIESHFDSVPKAGMYDGTVGVTTGLEVLHSFKENGVKTKRSIILIALTGEESSGFGMALFGSKGIALGLTEKELDQGKKGGQTIRQALDAQGQDSGSVKSPFGLQTKSPVVEIHVSQDNRLNESGVDLAVVENIAAPRRFEIKIGDELTPQEKPSFKNAHYFSVDVKGKAGHSGATPMGSENRADGFVAMSDILTFAKKIQERIKKEMGQDIEISVGGLSIEGQAMNKIPGLVSSQFRISADDPSALSLAEGLLTHFIDLRNTEYSKHAAFGKDPIQISHSEKDQSSDLFYNSQAVLDRHFRAGQIVKFINNTSNLKQYIDAKNVGTVGTYTFDKGQVTLNVDIRGIDKTLRDEMVSRVIEGFNILKGKNEIEYREIEGGGDPVAMNKELVDLAEAIIIDNKIGSVVRTNSPAGHDAQNFARAGHPTVMMFIPSRNGGIAHTPEEYSSPDDLQKGAQALAGLVYNLAMKSN